MNASIKPAWIQGAKAESISDLDLYDSLVILLSRMGALGKVLFDADMPKIDETGQVGLAIFDLSSEGMAYLTSWRSQPDEIEDADDNELAVTAIAEYLSNDKRPLDCELKRIEETCLQTIGAIGAAIEIANHSGNGDACSEELGYGINFLTDIVQSAKSARSRID